MSSGEGLNPSPNPVTNPALGFTKGLVIARESQHNENSVHRLSMRLHQFRGEEKGVDITARSRDLL